jgi:heparan-alpha-glucosaminide N-acetyltransferase
MIPAAPEGPPPRIMSIDALRGLVMFMMIFVNDLAGAPGKIVPDWMVHFSDRHSGGSGMTFVDLVFPGFLFIVGMSIPFALGSRLARGEPLWKIVLHVITRTLALLAIGILMVNDESPARETAGWSPTLWAAAMFLSAILAFCAILPRGAGADAAKFWKIFNACLRLIGFAGMVYLAFAFRGRGNQPIITLSPFHINTVWYGILGLIGWAYLVSSLVFLIFRANRTALLGCAVLLFCLYPADKTGLLDNFWLAKYVGIGEMLGSQAAISVAGVLLASILVAANMAGIGARTRFTLLFSAGCAAAALLVNGLYGISKNDATPSWCLWSCAITAAVWLIFYILADVRRVTPLSKPFAIAGQNVLLAYLISEGMESWLDLLHLGDWYDGLSEPDLMHACARSAGCGVVILTITAVLNRLGFRLKL